MKIKMVKDDMAAPLGHTVVSYKAGDEYDVPAFIGAHFVASGSATAADDAPAATKPAETKPSPRSRSKKVTAPSETKA